MRRSRPYGVVLACAMLAGWTPYARAQQASDSTAGFTTVDRIVAVVGDVPIPMSRLQERINVLRNRGVTIPTDSNDLAAFRHQVLEQMVNEELMVQAALRDTTVKVTDQQVQAEVDRQLKGFRSNFSNEYDFRQQLQAAGFGTPDEFRRYLAYQARRELLQSALVKQLQDKGVIRPIPLTDAELRDYYEQVKGQGAPRPATVSFRAIPVPVQATPEAMAAARQRADSILAKLRAGADFAAMAKQYSDDPGTKDQGGELGWFRRGQMVREFEQVAFRMRPGQISDVVKTPFGFHIIQVERVDPTEIEARHILIAPDVTDSDRAAAKRLADSLADALRHGAAIDSLAQKYGDPSEQAIYQDVVRDQLPKELHDAIADAKPGDIIGPVEVALNGRTHYLVIQFDSEQPAGEYTFQEVKNQVSDQLAQQKGVQRYIDALAGQTYVDVRL